MRPRLFGILAAVMIALSFMANVASAKQIVAPLPLSAAVGIKSAEFRSSKQFSPNGEWVTLPYLTLPERPDANTSLFFSTTGVPGTEGKDQRRVQLIHLPTGEAVELSQADDQSWGASWSPDGRRLAYYSDKGGEAGIWVWDVATHQSRRLGNVIARPFWFFEIPRWTADGRRLLVKLLPEGMTLAEANALLPNPTEMKRLFPARADGKPSVAVLRSGQDVAVSSSVLSQAVIDRSLADLALIDVGSGKVERVVVGNRISNYQLSPDQKHIAYIVPRGGLPNMHVEVSDLRVRTLASGEDRVLHEGLVGGYGNEFSWSPDSQRVAYLEKDRSGKRRVMVVGLDGQKREFAQELGFVGGYDDNSADVPLWDKSGRTVYILGGDALWRLDVASAKAVQVGKLQAIKLTRLVARADGNLLWQDGGRAWAFARDAKTSESLIVSIELASGRGRIALRGGEQAINYVAGDVTHSGLIAYLGSDPEHLEDLWLFDTRSGKRRQLTRLNAEIERYAHGETRRINWVSGRGEKLEGALMLPPGYKPGQKLPTVVWVYAGDRVGSALRKYGLGKGMVPVFNFSVLTTRGYAVFYPDIPVRTGELMDDTYAAVMPGIDALVEQGYTDPERLAVMGQSFGSYTVWALLVQTNRFKAAITTANVLHPDLFAQYLAMNPVDASATALGYLEKGQGNMGGDPWTYQERYLKNSPVFKLDKISTPLLMGQGSLDGDLRASDAMFVALRRLGKEVEYRVYEHEDHALQSRVNVFDFWQRRLEFLRDHLGSEGIAPDQPKVSLH